MSAYYNEFDPVAAAWLRELIKAGVIADGEVDERDIRDVRPDELAGFRQIHLFAGIGVWSYALRRGGYGDDAEILTVSCPCQPFSAAGARGGEADERHLWPAAFHIIGERRPRIVFGEQVASKDGLAWLDLVSTDLEAAGYAVGALDLCAAGFGAPNIRQRLYFAGAADSAHQFDDGTGNGRSRGRDEYPDGGDAGGLADADGGNASPERQQRGGEQRLQPQDGGTVDAAGERPGPVNGFWRAADWLFCRDDRWRPVEPGTFPLADGIAGRVGLLRGYGNALNAEVAAGFTQVVREVIGC